MQLANNFPGAYFGSDYAKSFDFNGYFNNQRQTEEAFKSQELNRAAALEDLFHQQQMNPIRQREGLNSVLRQEAELPGVKADTDLKTRKRDLEFSIPEETQRQAILAKLAKEISADELEKEKTQIEKWLVNPMISPRQREVLRYVRDQFTDLYKLHETNQTKLTQEELKLQRPPRVPVARPPAPPKPLGPPKNLGELETRLRAAALDEKDPDKRAELSAQADMIATELARKVQEKADAGGTGKVDLSGAGMPVRPGLQLPPRSDTAGRPARQAEAGKASLADVQKMYPGVPADKLKEAYKRKFGVDLR